MKLYYRTPQQGAVPPPPGETSDIHNPKDVLHTLNIVIMIVVLCLTTPLFTLRMYVRSIILRNMGIEECKSHLQLRFRRELLFCISWIAQSVRILLKDEDFDRELPHCIRMVKHDSYQSSTHSLTVNKASLLSYWVTSIFSEPTQRDSTHQTLYLTSSSVPPWVGYFRPRPL